MTLDSHTRTPPAAAPTPPGTTPLTEQTAAEQRALDGLEVEMTQLWGHINAAKCRFLELLAAFDGREGWARHGCASCAHWLNWQCGIGMVAAREHVRVARALASLPKIHDAFREARISYSKVRAMTRIATPENEETLLNVAVHGTAAHVDRLVGKYRSVERREAAAQANGQHRQRSVHYRWDEDGSMMITARMPAEVGEIIRRALDAAVEVIDSADAGAGAGAGAGDSSESGTNVSAEARRTPRAPETRTSDTDEPCPIGARRADGLRLLAERFLHQRTAACGSVADRFQVVVHIDQASLAAEAAAEQTAERPTELPAKAHTRADRCELEHGPRLAIDTARRLACDATVLGIVDDHNGDPLNIGRRTRSIPPALRRALAARDGGCRFPGCDRRHFTEGHHIVHWANGGETSLRNLITLCRHHHRLIHEGGFAVRATDDGAFIFSRPDGRHLPASGGAPAHATYPALTARNRRAGLQIDATTIRCRWGGENMDYHHAICALIGMRDRAARATQTALGPYADGDPR